MIKPVYPCTYRELKTAFKRFFYAAGISLYLQGTPLHKHIQLIFTRYIPVPTGNSNFTCAIVKLTPVYPCTYREL